ncbi:MAG TPA: UDP-glucose 4-epimerase, partial [Gemmatimonadales bacterium]|nr:UDP-glucose 4-epimerase [Gemmatimonadales bacterium]
GIETSVNRLAELIATAAGRPSEVRRAPARAGEIQRSALEVTKAGRELGWRPRVPLPEGLARTMRWIAEG